MFKLPAVQVNIKCWFKLVCTYSRQLEMLLSPMIISKKYNKNGLKVDHSIPTDW